MPPLSPPPSSQTHDLFLNHGYYLHKTWVQAVLINMLVFGSDHSGLHDLLVLFWVIACLHFSGGTLWDFPRPHWHWLLFVLYRFCSGRHVEISWLWHFPGVIRWHCLSRSSDSYCFSPRFAFLWALGQVCQSPISLQFGQLEVSLGASSCCLKTRRFIYTPTQKSPWASSPL